MPHYVVEQLPPVRGKITHHMNRGDAKGNGGVRESRHEDDNEFDQGASPAVLWVTDYIMSPGDLYGGCRTTKARHTIVNDCRPYAFLLCV